MQTFIEISQALVGADPGLKLILMIALVFSVVAFWREKSRNERTASERLKESRADTELLVETVNEAVHTVREFKASNEALREAFNRLSVSVREKLSRGGQ